MISISLLIFGETLFSCFSIGSFFFFWAGQSMVSFGILNTFILANLKSLSDKSNIWAYSRQFLLIAFFLFIFFISLSLSLSLFKTE